MKKLLVIGGTGLVGQQIIHQALALPQIEKVIAPTRRPIIPHTKLYNPIIDFSALPEQAEWWAADAILCALGTTRQQAGSKEAFKQVDHDYVLASAKLAKLAGTYICIYNSALGANIGSRSYYLKVKGKTELDLKKLGFTSLCHIRPSLLEGGKRPDFRPVEWISIHVAHLFAPVIPLRYRVVSTQKVAEAMLNASLKPEAGTWVIESDALHSI